MNKLEAVPSMKSDWSDLAAHLVPLKQEEYFDYEVGQYDDAGTLANKIRSALAARGDTKMSRWSVFQIYGDNHETVALRITRKDDYRFGWSEFTAKTTQETTITTKTTQEISGEAMNPEAAELDSVPDSDLRLPKESAPGSASSVSIPANQGHPQIEGISTKEAPPDTHLCARADIPELPIELRSAITLYPELEMKEMANVAVKLAGHFAEDDYEWEGLLERQCEIGSELLRWRNAKAVLDPVIAGWLSNYWGEDWSACGAPFTTDQLTSLMPALNQMLVNLMEKHELEIGKLKNFPSP